MKKLLSFLLVLVLMSTLFAAAALADDDGPAPDAVVYVTISVAGEIVAPAVPVLVTDRNADGVFDVDEVLYCAHEQLYDGGAEAGYASATGDYGLFLTKLWGDESGSFGYYVDDKMAMGAGDQVPAGGKVNAFVYTDATYWSDIYAYFDQTDAVTEDGTLTLTLFAAAGYDESWNVVFAPCAGAVITCNGEATEFVTDENGQVTVCFDAAGSYLLSAVSDSAILVPPVCKVTADQAAAHAEEPAPVAAADAVVSVTISVAGEIVAPAVPVLVSDRNADGGFDVDEVLYCAHDQLYPGGAEAGYASSEGDWGLGLDMLWGDTSYAFGYYVDNAMAWGLSDPVQAGGSVYAYVYTDKEYYSDIYAYFDQTDAVAEDGTLTLTLFAGSFDENWNVVFAPYAGATITCNGEATEFVTDENGQVTLCFDAAGSYLLSAVSDSAILVPAVCKVTAAQAAAPAEEPAAEEPAPAETVTYTVVRGDCLWKIARKFYGDGKKWADIYNANASIIKNPNLIYAGQVLLIP